MIKIPAKLYFILPAAAAILLGIALLANKAHTATGFDGYYYALQTKAISDSGKLVIADNPLVFYICGIFSKLCGNAVCGDLIVKILVQAAVASVLYLLLLKITGQVLPGLAAAAIWLFSFAGMSYNFEYLKNNAGNLVILLYLLANCHEMKLRVRTLVAAGFFLLALFTHDLSAGLVLLSALFLLGRETIPLVKGHERKRLIIVAVIVTFVSAAAVFVSLRFDQIAEILREVSVASVFSRYSMIIHSFHPPLVRIEIFLLAALGLPFSIAMLFFLRRFDRGLQTVLVLLTVLSLPVLRFGWQDTSFRFLLQSMLFLGILLCSFISFRLRTVHEKRGPKRVKAVALRAALLVLPLAFLLILPAGTRLMKKNYQPDYSMLLPLIDPIAAYAGDAADVIIAHHGFASMIWYYTGIQGEHFTRPEASDRIWRVAYGFGPIHFEDYLEKGDYEPLALSSFYTLLPEKVWQRFYNDRKDDIAFLGSWFNPHLDRPRHVSRIINDRVGGD